MFWLLASLGGMAAFIGGISVVSLVELLYLVLISAIKAIRYCCNRYVVYVNR